MHQLLLPLVRRGWIAAGRGRLGGYRLTPKAKAATAFDVISVFARHGGLALPDTRSPEWVGRLEERADKAYRTVFASITIGDLASEVRAVRDALTWSI